MTFLALIAIIFFIFSASASIVGVISSMTAHSWRRRGSGDSTIPLASMAILSGCYIKS